MTNQVANVSNEIQKLVAKFPSGVMKDIIQAQLREKYPSGLLANAMDYALDNLLIQQVLDDPPEESGILDDLVWYLKPIDDDTVEKLQKLLPMDFALMRILHTRNDEKDRGRISITSARKELERRGVDCRDLEYSFVEDLIGKYYASEDGEWVIWFYLIPEYEKTEEYKKAEEEAQRERDEKESLRVYMEDLLDLASSIRKVLKNKPDGLPKDKIVEQLPKFLSDYIEDAFHMCLEDEDIELVQKSDDIEWYRLVVHDEENDE
jgi:hypothetical protein